MAVYYLIFINFIMTKLLRFSTRTQYGFVAQDLEKVLPLLVENGTHPGENKTNPQIKYKAVNYIGLTPVLTKAMQKQQQLIDNNKKQLMIYYSEFQN